MQPPRTLLLTTALLLLLGCEESRPAAANIEPSVRIWHVVIIRLNHPGDAADQRRLIEATHTLGQIPGVVTVHVGKVLPGDRPHKVSDFDVAVIMGFRSAEDLAAYASHPLHVKAVNEALKPLAKDYTIYDFSEE